MIDMMLPILTISLLMTALGSIILYQKTSHELSRLLAVCVAIVALVWSFAIAHWSINLVFLILLFQLKRRWSNQEV